VRTLIRIVASGQPKMPDEHFDPQSTLVEDRVVLFVADSFEDAVRQGEAEARRYCRDNQIVNVYGQRVHLRYLKVADAFRIDQEPVAGAEVYSSLALVPSVVSRSTLIKTRFGNVPPAGARSRYKFIDAQILAEAMKR
jgi:hypothetical protein